MRGNSRQVETFVIGDKTFTPQQTEEPEFWHCVRSAGTVVAGNQTYSGIQPIATLNRSQLDVLFPEGMDAPRWEEPNDAYIAEAARRCDADIGFLRGADFSHLCQQTRFTKDDKTFADLAKETFTSDLAGELVRRGFITINFAEYSSTFYGSFVGVDVAAFYHRSVQPNKMRHNHRFTSAKAIANLLEQAPEDFATTVCVLNLQVVRYLLTEYEVAARQAVDVIATDTTGDATAFLDTFLNESDPENSPTARSALVKLLAARPWPGLFDCLTATERITDLATRIRLVDAALQRARPADEYHLGDDAVTFLARHYPDLAAFTDARFDSVAPNVFSFAVAAGIVFDELANVAAGLHDLAIVSDRYTITARNLRSALGTRGSLALDEIRGNDAVWEYCRANADQYLVAIRDDRLTKFTVHTPAVLEAVINDQHETWTVDQVRAVVDGSHADAALPDLEKTPATTWPILLDARRVVPNVANVWAYAQKNNVDEHLADFLAPAGKLVQWEAVDQSSASDRVQLAVRILNARSIPAKDRVTLVFGLDLPKESVAAADLVPAADDLLVRVLDAGLVPDTAETFRHFRDAGGWASVSAVFVEREELGGFFGPGLLAPIMANLLESAEVSDGIKSAVLDQFDAYLSGNPEALLAAGRCAKRMGRALTVEQILHVARSGAHESVIMYLLWRAKDAPIEQLVQALVLLGAPYDRLAAGSPGREFEIPQVPYARAVFGRLAKSGRVTLVTESDGNARVEVLV